MSVVLETGGQVHDDLSEVLGPRVSSSFGWEDVLGFLQLPQKALDAVLNVL